MFLCYSVFHHLMATYHCCWKLSSNLFVCFLQAVYHRPSLSSVVLLLPLLHLMNQFEEGAFGCGRVPVHWPTQELELLDHTVPVLWLQNKRTNRTLNTPQNQTKCTYIKRTPKVNQTHVYQTHPKLWEEEEKKSEGRRRRWEEEEWQGRMSWRKKRKEKKRKGKGERREEMSGRAESERRKEKHFPPHTNQDWRETRRDDSGTILHWNKKKVYTGPNLYEIRIIYNINFLLRDKSHFYSGYIFCCVMFSIRQGPDGVKESGAGGVKTNAPWPCYRSWRYD